MERELILYSTCFLKPFLRFFGFLVAFSWLRNYLGYVNILCVSIALALPAFGEQIQDGNSLAKSLTPPYGMWQMLMLSGTELLQGFLLALPLALAFHCLPMSGRIADVSRGAQFGEQMLPGIARGVTPLESVTLLLAPLLLFLFSGYQFVFRNVYNSLTISGASIASFAEYSWVVQLISVSAQAIYFGVLIAAPVMLCCFSLDLATMFLTRSLGRVNLLFELLPAKLLVGVVIFVITGTYAQDSIFSFLLSSLETNVEGYGK